MSILKIERSGIRRMMERAARFTGMPVDQALHNVRNGLIEGPVADELMMLQYLMTPPNPQQRRDSERIRRRK